MRIRKRAVPLPFSLLTPVPFSDPHLHLVQLSQPSDLPAPPPSHLHDLPRLIRHDHLPTAAPASPRSVAHLVKTSFEDEKTKKEQTQESNSTSKQSDLGAVADDNGVELIPLPLPLSNQTKVDGMTTTEGRWCDGDKAIPLKKRKASFVMNGIVVTGEYSKMKSKTNKKCSLEIDDDDDDDDDDLEDDDSDSDTSMRKRKKKKASKKKKTMRKKKGGSLIEGSRCSRVNGRGWRCMQPTLVGYSLCEHHLGKGRLRTMSSVRARSINLPISCNAGKPSQELNIIRDDHVDDDDDGDDVGQGRKRMRVGMVKARSLSSLLCQPNTSSVIQIGAAIKQHEIK